MADQTADQTAARDGAQGGDEAQISADGVMDALVFGAGPSLGWADVAALALFVAALAALSLRIEDGRSPRPSLGWLMAQRRRDWMRNMAVREVRIMDTQLLALQHRGAAFFASATMIGIGGVAALIGSADRLVSVASDLSTDIGAAEDAARTIWELKLLFLTALLAAAFLHFVWSHRLFGYCAVMMGATPEIEAADEAARRRVADQAAEINIRAGRSFNRGLRVLYFSLASLAWLLGPAAFALASVLTAGMLYRREFLSGTRAVLDAGEVSLPERGSALGGGPKAAPAPVTPAAADGAALRPWSAKAAERGVWRAPRSLVERL